MVGRAFFGPVVERGAAVATPVVDGGTFSERVADSYEAARRLDNVGGADLLLIEETERRLNEIEALTGQRLPHPYRDQFDEVDEDAIVSLYRPQGRGSLAAQRQRILADKQNALEARVNALAADYPSIETTERFIERVQTRARELELQQEDAGFGAGLVGGVGAAFADPINVLTLPLGGGGRTVLSAALREMAIGAGIEAAVQPAIADQRTELGLDFTLGDAARNIAAAGVFSGAFGGGAKAVENLLTGPREPLIEAVDALPEQQLTPAVRDAVTDLEREFATERALTGGGPETLTDIEADVAALEAAIFRDDDGLSDHLAATAEADNLVYGQDRFDPQAAPEAPGAVPSPELVPEPVRLSNGVDVEVHDGPHAQLLKAAAEDTQEVFDDLLPLFEGRVRYRGSDGQALYVRSADDLRLASQQWLEEIRNDPVAAERPLVRGGTATAGYQAALRSRAGEHGFKVPSEPVEPGALEAGVPIASFETFDPKDLAIDAKRFQFKAAGDGQGVTDALQGVERWDPIKAGEILIWEAANGQRFVADGHQRSGLARRLSEQGQDISLRGFVLREADGVTAEEARAIAAAKNMAQGTGTAADAAKVLRTSPELLNGSLKPRTAVFRNAQALTRLGDDAFAMVINDVVGDGEAAIVGRLIEDPAEQVAIISLLARQRPANLTEAEALVREAQRAGFAKTETENLFGTDTVTEALLTERAAILGSAVRRIRRDRRLFASLDENADDIEAAGNSLDRTRNQELAQNASEIAETVLRTSSLSGPVADALRRVVELRQRGTSRAAAVRDFVNELRELGPTALRNLDGRGRALGGDGLDDRTAAPSARSEAPGARLGGDAPDLFDDAAAGSERQRTALEASELSTEEELLLVDYDKDGPVLVSAQRLKDEIDQENRMLDRMEGCVTR